MSVARIELVPDVLQDFARILEHFVATDVEDPAGRLEAMLRRIEALERYPEMGRRLSAGCNDLSIRYLSPDYVALYEYVAAIRTVFVLAVRSGQDAGYARE